MKSRMIMKQLQGHTTFLIHFQGKESGLRVQQRIKKSNLRPAVLLLFHITLVHQHLNQMDTLWQKNWRYITITSKTPALEVTNFLKTIKNGKEATWEEKNK